MENRKQLSESKKRLQALETMLAEDYRRLIAIEKKSLNLQQSMIRKVNNKERNTEQL